MVMKNLPIIVAMVTAIVLPALSTALYKSMPKTYTITFKTDEYKVHEKYPELLTYGCVMSNEKLTSKKWEDGKYVERERSLYICKDRTLWR